MHVIGVGVEPTHEAALARVKKIYAATQSPARLPPCICIESPATHEHIRIQAAVRRAMFEQSATSTSVASVLCAVQVPLGAKRKATTSWSVVYAIVGDKPPSV